MQKHLNDCSDDETASAADTTTTERQTSLAERPERYRFGPFVLDVQQRIFLKNDSLIGTEPKVFDLLVALVRHRDRVMSRDELMRRLWSDTNVCEGALNQCIAVLRRILGESAARPHFIRTVHRCGYQFIVDERTWIKVHSLRGPQHAQPGE